MHLTNALLVLSTAISVSAHPSNNHHHHQHHAKRTNNFYKSSRPPVAFSPPPTNVKAEGTPDDDDTPTPANPPPPSDPAPATGARKEFCQGMTKRATLENIYYLGNLGADGNWGCNFMEIANGDVSLYPYTMTFHSPSSDFTCHCFNKFGPDRLLTGSFQNSALTLRFAKGETKSVALDTNTQGACACGPGGDVPVCGPIGQWTGTWVEMDMGSEPNGGQSGADVSVLAVQDCAKLHGIHQSFPGMRIQANGNTCSWVKTDGVDSFQAYIGETHAADGIGCTGYTENNLDIVLGDDF